MSRRGIVIAAIVAAIIVLLVAAHSFDLVGALKAMHGR